MSGNHLHLEFLYSLRKRPLYAIESTKMLTSILIVEDLLIFFTKVRQITGRDH